MPTFTHWVKLLNPGCFCLGYDMSTFIRRYGRYLNEKAFAYRQMAFDFTRVKKGYVCWLVSFITLIIYHHRPAKSRETVLRCSSAEGVMRTMTTEKLLKGMPVLQTQIDTLLEFDVRQEPAPVWLNATVSRHRRCALPFLFSGSSQGAEQRHHQCCVPAALQGPGQTVRLLQRRHHQPVRWVDAPLRLKDISIRVAPNVQLCTAEKYFKMKKSDCKEALEIYKRFLTRVTKIGEFMKLAEVRDDLTVTPSWRKTKDHQTLFFPTADSWSWQKWHPRHQLCKSTALILALITSMRGYSKHKHHQSPPTHTHTNTPVTHPPSSPHLVSPPRGGGGSSRFRWSGLTFPTSRKLGNHSNVGFCGWVPVFRMQCQHVDFNPTFHSPACVYFCDWGCFKTFLTPVSNIKDVKYAALSKALVSSLINCYFSRLLAVSWRVWKHTWMVWRMQKVERRGKNMFHCLLFSLAVCWSQSKKNKMMNRVTEKGLNRCRVSVFFKCSSLLLPLCSFGIPSEGWAYTQHFVCSLIAPM